MDNDEKTNQELLKENVSLKDEINELKRRLLELEQAEDALKQERKYILQLFDVLPYGVYRLKSFAKDHLSDELWNETSIPPFHVEFVNNRFCEIFNISKNAFQENPFVVLNAVYEEDKQDWVEKNIESQSKGIPFKWEGRFLLDNKINWLQVESLPSILENGDIVWTGIVSNIDERIKAKQERIKINLELKKINSEKDKFFSIIAHDLKAPFNSIIGFSEILSDNISSNDIDGIKKYAEIIHHSSESAINLLMNLIVWSQSQTGKMEFKPETFNLYDLIDDTLELYIDIAKQKTIKLINDLSENTFVQADKSMLSTVIRNLVSNALKFTLPSGRICISAKTAKNEITVSVNDTGVGIPKATVENIFRLDKNISTPGTQNEKGTGLGLILCKEFIELHNGKIWLESQPDLGSTFYFSIPLTHNSNEAENR